MSLGSSFRSLENVGYKTYNIRNKKVVLDSDVGRLFQMTTKRVNEKVKRNKKYFHDGEVFKVTVGEFKIMRSQINNVSKVRSYYKPLNGDKKNSATSNISETMTSDTAVMLIKPGGRQHPPWVFTEKGFNSFSKLFRKLNTFE